MLYIENIDDCNFTMYGSTSQSGKVVLSKKGVTAKGLEPAYNEIKGRIRIWDAEKEEYLLAGKKVAEINLNGSVYTDTEAFVLAFNAMIGQCDEVSGGGGSADIDLSSIENKLQEIIDYVSKDCNNWANGTVENTIETLVAGDINSCTIIIEEGSVVVGNGDTVQTLIEGMSITVEAKIPLEQDIIIDATSGKAHYVITYCGDDDSEVTSTTEQETSTTTLVEGTTTTLGIVD